DVRVCCPVIWLARRSNRNSVLLEVKKRNCVPACEPAAMSLETVTEPTVPAGAKAKGPPLSGFKVMSNSACAVEEYAKARLLLTGIIWLSCAPPVNSEFEIEARRDRVFKSKMKAAVPLIVVVRLTASPSLPSGVKDNFPG